MKIETTYKVSSPDYNPKKWELFDGNPNAIRVAMELNKTFMDAVNAGGDRNEVRRKVNVVMEKWSDVGADDSEPSWVLADLIVAVFGERTDGYNDR